MLQVEAVKTNHIKDDETHLCRVQSSSLVCIAVIIVYSCSFIFFFLFIFIVMNLFNLVFLKCSIKLKDVEICNSTIS